MVTLLIVEKEERTPMNRKQKEEWTRFHSGKWTLAMPEAPGRYPTMGVLGDPGDVITVVGLPSGGLYTPSKWRGYFWSEPLPDNYGLPALSKEIRAGSTGVLMTGPSIGSLLLPSKKQLPS